ncbi:hypothetical protein NEIG_02296 [Nematocida sp. ERTm5]|nr:hypothetical protein NEIG_02296 [Nematocida sp. ERTm5]
MELLPVRARANECTPHASELFFIHGKKYTPEYFITSVFPFLPGLEKDSSSNSKPNVSAIRVYEDLLAQIKKYSTEIERFSKLPNAPGISISVDFKIPNYLHIQDKVCFKLPIKNEPEIYAADLFQSHSLPDGEMLTIFIFYIRESILARIKEILQSPEDQQKKDSAELQQCQAHVYQDRIESLNQSLLRYESFGKVSVMKEGEKKERKKIQKTN